MSRYNDDGFGPGVILGLILGAVIGLCLVLLISTGNFPHEVGALQSACITYVDRTTATGSRETRRGCIAGTELINILRAKDGIK